MLRTLVVCAVTSLVLLLSAVAGAATTATVRGAELLNVRRGPSTDTPAFATFRRGATVSVESVSGQWALIVLSGGERGYVKTVFLELPAAMTAETRPPEVPQTPAAIAMQEAAANTTASPAVVEEQLAQVLERVRALESAMAPPSTDPSGTPERMAAAVTAETPIMLTPASSPADLREIGPSLALAGVGLVVGFLLGVAYGQRQERNRRNRVRF